MGLGGAPEKTAHHQWIILSSRTHVDRLMSSTDRFDLEISHLKKSFGPNPVLKGISFAVHPGDFVGLMGPNGAGKSTLIKILAGVYTASSGELRLGGRVVRSLAQSPEVGFIHQELGLVDGLTISENLSLGLPPKRLVGPILNNRAEREEAAGVLSRVGLDLHPDTPLGDLTAGENPPSLSRECLTAARVSWSSTRPPRRFRPTPSA